MRLNHASKHSVNTWQGTAISGCREQGVKVFVDEGVMWPFCEKCAQHDAARYRVGVDRGEFITIEEAKLLLIKEAL